VFAVGVVLYELFAHQQAFTGDTPFLVLQEIVHSTPERLVQVDPTLDPRLDQIVWRAIVKDPQARCPDMDVMRRDLMDALRHTEQDQPWGREKTMVLLARAAGATGLTRAGPAGQVELRRTETGEIIRTPCSNIQHIWVVRNGEAPTPDTDAAALEAVAS
jgi:hypothetical protein